MQLFLRNYFTDNIWSLQGSYTLKMRMLDGDKQELTCITFDFSIGFLSETDTVADS